MSLPKIFGIYLNNLSWHQVGDLYLSVFKGGKAKYKIDRINDMINKLKVLPDNEMIQQYLFAGRLSVNWYKLLPHKRNSVSSIKKKLDSISPEILSNGNYNELDDNFRPVHAIEKQHKLFITLGTGDYRDSITIQNFTLQSSPSEYFCTVVIRDDKNIIEIRSNETQRLQILNTAKDLLGIKTENNNGRNLITEDTFMNFKGSIPDSQIKKYKGKNLNPQSITELFEFTARQGVDYAQNVDDFVQMRANSQDLSLTITFEYNGSTFPFRFNLLTGSLYFPAIVSEDAIDYIFEIQCQQVKPPRQQFDLRL
jgi:hypothetical protein